MPTFDFDRTGTVAGNTNFTSATSFTIDLNVIDASEGVSFAWSYQVSFAAPSTGTIGIIQNSTGFQVSYMATNMGSNVAATNAAFEIEPTGVPPRSQSFLPGEVLRLSTTGGGNTTLTDTGLSTNDSVFFTISTANVVFITSLTATLACFCAGTRIATVDGSKAVEDLGPGDRLRLADGGETTVKWLGRQTVSKTFADPRKVNPICITARAIGNERDLYVSPDHGIALEGYLINASALLNGETIYEVAEMPGDFAYYHVETEAHEVILAEGIPTESYVDLPSRDVFDNGHERANAAMIQPMDIPRISSARLLPDATRARLFGGQTERLRRSA